MQSLRTSHHSSQQQQSNAYKASLIGATVFTLCPKMLGHLGTKNTVSPLVLNQAIITMLT